MEEYFRNELAEGKTEFRLVAEIINGVVKVMIHPMWAIKKGTLFRDCNR